MHCLGFDIIGKIAQILYFFKSEIFNGLYNFYNVFKVYI